MATRGRGLKKGGGGGRRARVTSNKDMKRTPTDVNVTAEMCSGGRGLKEGKKKEMVG